MSFVLVWFIQSSVEWLLAIWAASGLNDLMCGLGSDTEGVAVESWFWIWHGFGSTIDQHHFIVNWAGLHLWEQWRVHAMASVDEWFVKDGFHWIVRSIAIWVVFSFWWCGIFGLLFCFGQNIFNVDTSNYSWSLVFSEEE